MTDREYTGSGNVANSGGITQEEIYKFKERIAQLELLSPPVGTIIAHSKSSYTNASNGGRADDAALDTPAELDAFLISTTGGKWRVCYGQLVSDAESWWNGKYLANLTDDRFLAGTTANPGVIGGVNTQDTPVAISGGVCAARASFCNCEFGVCGSTAIWADCSTNCCTWRVIQSHDHRHQHNHGVARQNNGCGTMYINQTSSNCSQTWSGGADVGRNGGDGTDTSVTTFNRNPGYCWYTMGAGNSYTDSCCQSFFKCRLNSGQCYHYHTFNSCWLNHTCRQTTHTHGNTFAANATAWDNRPQWFSTFFIIRVK